MRTALSTSVSTEHRIQDSFELATRDCDCVALNAEERRTEPCNSSTTLTFARVVQKPSGPRSRIQIGLSPLSEKCASKLHFVQPLHDSRFEEKIPGDSQLKKGPDCPFSGLQAKAVVQFQENLVLSPIHHLGRRRPYLKAISLLLPFLAFLTHISEPIAAPPSRL